MAPKNAYTRILRRVGVGARDFRPQDELFGVFGVRFETKVGFKRIEKKIKTSEIGKNDHVTNPQSAGFGKINNLQKQIDS